jgi:hypothetical protein
MHDWFQLYGREIIKLGFNLCSVVVWEIISIEIDLIILHF